MRLTRIDSFNCALLTLPMRYPLALTCILLSISDSYAAGVFCTFVTALHMPPLHKIDPDKEPKNMRYLCADDEEAIFDGVHAHCCIGRANLITGECPSGCRTGKRSKREVMIKILMETVGKAEKLSKRIKVEDKADGIKKILVEQKSYGVFGDLHSQNGLQDFPVIEIKHKNPIIRAPFTFKPPNQPRGKIYSYPAKDLSLDSNETYPKSHGSGLVELEPGYLVQDPSNDISDENTIEDLFSGLKSFETIEDVGKTDKGVAKTIEDVGTTDKGVEKTGKIVKKRKSAPRKRVMASRKRVKAPKKKTRRRKTGTLRRKTGKDDDQDDGGNPDESIEKSEQGVKKRKKPVKRRTRRRKKKDDGDKTDKGIRKPRKTRRRKTEKRKDNTDDGVKKVRRTRRRKTEDHGDKIDDDIEKTEQSVKKRKKAVKRKPRRRKTGKDLKTSTDVPKSN